MEGLNPMNSCLVCRREFRSGEAVYVLVAASVNESEIDEVGYDDEDRVIHRSCVSVLSDANAKPATNTQRSDCLSVLDL